MKKTVILLVFLFLLGMTGCNGKPDNTEPTASTPALTKTVYVHSSITQEYSSTVNRTEFLFDEQDHVSQVVVYTNKLVTKRHDVECDENGNYIKWVSDGSVTEYFYDERGHSLGMSLYVNDVLISSTQYTWENDLRTSITTKMETQGMTQRILMTYNNVGHLLRQDVYTADTLTNYSIYTTDENGRTTAVTIYQPDGTLLSSSTYTREGLKETITSTLPDGTVNQIVVLTYDEHGNLLTQEIYDSSNNLVSKETHTWKAVVVPIDCPRASV
jgi:antitoxin component YwqK of YwqJK toxin-antitoxin module